MDIKAWVRDSRKIELDDFHVSCLGILCQAYRCGIYDLPVVWKRFAEDNIHPSIFHAEISHKMMNPLSTFDSNGLTTLVVAAHEHCVRISLAPSAKEVLEIYMHPRRREGSLSGRHPVIEDAVESYRSIATVSL